MKLGQVTDVTKQPLEVFYKKSYSQKFRKFTGKHLCWSPFLINLQAFRTAILLKLDINTGAFL